MVQIKALFNLILVLFSIERPCEVNNIKNEELGYGNMHITL